MYKEGWEADRFVSTKGEQNNVMVLLFRSWGWIDPAVKPLQGSVDYMRVSVLAGQLEGWLSLMLDSPSAYLKCLSLVVRALLAYVNLSDITGFFHLGSSYEGGQLISM